MNPTAELALVVLGGILLLAAIVLASIAAEETASTTNTRQAAQDEVKRNQEIIQKLGNDLQLPVTGIVAGTYTAATMTINNYGIVISVSDGPSLTSLTAGEGLAGGTLAGTSGTLTIQPKTNLPIGTPVDFPQLTLDASGMVTAFTPTAGVVKSVQLGQEFGGSTITTSGEIKLQAVGGGELRLARAEQHPPTSWTPSSLGTGGGTAGVHSLLLGSAAADGKESVEVLYNDDGDGLSSFGLERVVSWSAVGL